MLHGFPYDPRAYDEVATRLAQANYRVIVPYLRGYSPTRFLRADTVRSGQQGALGQDLLDLLDALAIKRATLVGYDWGGRAACIVAALFPERTRLLVTVGGYNIQNIATSSNPASPEMEYRAWYQYYFNTERGRNGLTQNRHDFCKLLWELWSPTWRFDDQTYDQTAASFDNSDFVDVVIHSYRHRLGAAPGDPRFDAIERLLAERPAITVPTLALYPTDDGVAGGPIRGELKSDPAITQRLFAGSFEEQLIADAGHNPAQEKPQEVAEAILQRLERYK